MKKYILILALFLPVFSMSLLAQETYRINEHGTYVIDSGTLIKVPVRKWDDNRYDYIHGFWEDMFVSQYYDSPDGIVLFNIKNGAITEIPGEAFFYGSPVFLRNYVYFSMLYGSYIYKFDKVTLELVEKIFAGTLSKPKYSDQEGETLNEEKIGDRTVRYTTINGKTIDVSYGPKVEMSEWWNFSVYYFYSNPNQYVIKVIFDDGK
jgi:hypothetical protein